MVLEALSGTVPCVIAAPGGVVLDPVVRAALVDAFVVWLRTEPATLAGGFGRATTVRSWRIAPSKCSAQWPWIESHLYADVADVTIDTDHVDPESVATMADAPPAPGEQLTTERAPCFDRRTP